MIRPHNHLLAGLCGVFLSAAALASDEPAPDPEASALPAAPENNAPALTGQILDLNRILIAKENEIASVRSDLKAAAAELERTRRAATAEAADYESRIEKTGKALADLRASCTSLVAEVAAALENGAIGRRDARTISRDFPESAAGVARIRELLATHADALAAARKSEESSLRDGKEIADLQTALRNSQASAGALQRALEDREKELSDSKTLSNKRDSELAELGQQVANLKKRVADESAAAIADKERVIDDADKRVAAVAADRDALRKQVSEIAATAPEKDRKIESLSKQIEFLQREIMELRESVRTKDEETKAAKDEATRASAEKETETAAMRTQVEQSAEIQSQLRRELAATRAAKASNRAEGGDEVGRMMALEGAPLATPRDARKEQKVSELLRKTKDEVKNAPAGEIP